MSKIKKVFENEIKNRIIGTEAEIRKNPDSIDIKIPLNLIKGNISKKQDNTFFLNNTFDIKGMLTDSPYANWMWMGKKSHIVSNKDTTHMVNKAIYLMDKENCYGVIRLHYPNKITLEQLMQRKEFHLMSDEDIEKLKDTDIFEYSYDWIHKFDAIMPWNFSKSMQDEYGFIENIEFISEMKEKKEKEYSNSIDAIVIDKSFDNNGREIYHLGLPYNKESSGRIIDVSGNKFFFIGRAKKYDVKVPIGTMVKVLFDKTSRCKLCDRIEIQKPYIKEASYKENPSSYILLNNSAEGEKPENIEIRHTSILSNSLPLRMKRNFTRIMESKTWMPYAMHFHSEGGKTGVHVGLFIPSEEYGKILTYFDAEELCEKDKLEGIIEGFSLSVKEGVGIDYNDGILNKPNRPHPIFTDGRFGDILCVPISYGIYTINEISDTHFEIEFRTDKNICINPFLLAEIGKIMPFGNGAINLVDSYNVRLQPNGRLKFEKSRMRGRDSLVTPQQMQKIYILRENMSISEICNEVRLSHYTVYRVLDRLGM